MDYGALAKAPGFLAKPEPRRREKGRKDRAESKVLKAVREAVMARDGGCRILKAGSTRAIVIEAYGLCAGPLTLAHLRRRSSTRGMDVRIRHRVDEAVCLCARHHDLEERHELCWRYYTTDKANGPIEWRLVPSKSGGPSPARTAP